MRMKRPSLRTVTLPGLPRLTANFNDEGFALLGEAEDVAQEALAMMERGRRTLKEARQKQHQVRMSRKYYRTNFKPSGSTSAVASGTDQKCFRCGGPHKTSCPKAMATTTASSAEEQAALSSVLHKTRSPRTMRLWSPMSRTTTR